MLAYQGEFANWSDVQREFQMNVPEPEQVLYACYDVPSYEGYANVIYRNGNKFYWVYGSHCSCYGLENQWEPEEYDGYVLLEVFRKGNFYQFENDDVKNYLIELLQEYVDNYVNAGHA